MTFQPSSTLQWVADIPALLEPIGQAKPAKPGLIHIVQVTIFLALLLSCLHELVPLWLC